MVNKSGFTLSWLRLCIYIRSIVLINDGWVLVFSCRSFSIFETTGDDDVEEGKVEGDSDKEGDGRGGRKDARTEEGVTETESVAFFVFLFAKLRKISSIREPGPFPEFRSWTVENEVYGIVLVTTGRILRAETKEFHHGIIRDE